MLRLVQQRWAGWPVNQARALRISGVSGLSRIRVAVQPVAADESRTTGDQDALGNRGHGGSGGSPRASELCRVVIRDQPG